MAKASENGKSRQRRDYIVVVSNKDGTKTQFDCGPSLKGATQVHRAVQQYGGKAISNVVIAAVAHRETAAGVSIVSLEDALAD